MTRENQRIREAARDAGVNLWEVAERLKIADQTLSRRLRRELPEEAQEKILGIIADIAAGR